MDVLSKNLFFNPFNKKTLKKPLKFKKKYSKNTSKKIQKKKNKFGEIVFSLSQITLTSKIKVQNHHHRTHLVR